MARNRIEDEKFADIAKILKEVYNFDIDSMQEGMLKVKEGAPVYKLAFKTAVLDLFKKVAKDGLVFSGKRGNFYDKDLIVGRTYWCMLNIGSSVCQKNNSKKTLQFTGIRKCRLGAISLDRENLIVFPMAHLLGQGEQRESTIISNPQFISISQVILNSEERQNNENLMDYFSGVDQKAGTVYSYKAHDFNVKYLLEGKVADNICRPTLESWEYSIKNEKRLDEYPLREQFKLFMNGRLDASKDLEMRLPSEVLESFEGKEPTLYNYVMSRSEITRYMGDAYALFDNLYYLFEEMIVKEHKQAALGTENVLLSKENYAFIFKFIDEYFEAIKIFFDANSHGISAKNAMNSTLRDVDILIGGVYENVSVGVGVNSLSKASGMQKVVVIGVEPNTQDIICYPIIDDKICSYNPLILKPISFMTDNLKQTDYFDVHDEVNHMIDSLFSGETEEIEQVKNFPIFKGTITNRWDKNYASKYIEFLFKQFDPEIGISKVYPKKRFSYYCSNVDGDEGSDPSRYISFPDVAMGSKSIRVAGEFSNVLTFGHYKNMLYYGLCDVSEALSYIFNTALYKPTNRAGYCADMMEALNIVSKDGENLVPLIQKIVEDGRHKRGIDQQLFEKLVGMVVYSNDSQSSGELTIEEIMRML